VNRPFLVEATMQMKCTDLASRIEQLRPGADVRDVARLCLLLCNSQQDLEELSDDAALTSAWRTLYLRMQATTEQHAAVTEELESFVQSDRQTSNFEKFRVLFRTIKIQSQIIRMYVGEPVLEV
jgi:hypothetical protein